MVFADGAGTVAAGVGTTSINAAASGNWILAGTGNTTVDSGGAANSVWGSYNGYAGNVTASLSGSRDLVSTGNSSGSVTTAGSNAFVQGGVAGTTLNVIDTGSHDVFNGVSSTEVATLSGSAAYFQGGSAGSTMTVLDTALTIRLTRLEVAWRSPQAVEAADSIEWRKRPLVVRRRRKSVNRLRQFNRVDRDRRKRRGSVLRQRHGKSGVRCRGIHIDHLRGIQSQPRELLRSRKPDLFSVGRQCHAECRRRIRQYQRLATR